MLSEAVRPPRTQRGRAARPSPLGLELDPQLDFESWRRLGARIASRADVTTWWLGDWLAFGERRYGRRYRDAVDATGLDYQTLRNYASVARHFPMARRHPNLSFQHHAEVCALDEDEQDRWLALAERYRWSRRELRRQLHRATEPAQPEPGVMRLLRLKVDSGRESRWREASARCHCSLEDWAARTLDAAAERE
jgi:hypothetical protein